MLKFIGREKFTALQRFGNTKSISYTTLGVGSRGRKCKFFTLQVGREKKIHNNVI